MTSGPGLRQLIADLNHEARRQLGAAADQGRFEDLVTLTPIAREIALLAERWPADSQRAGSKLDAAVNGDAQADPGEQVAELNAPVSAPPSRLRKADYPQFLRERDEMVKLGWSPRERGAYEHRVPKKGVDVVLAAVGVKGKVGHRFTMDEVLERVSSAKGNDQMPSYQVYAVMSWLKWAGMILQHGRQGYTIVRPQTFATSVQAAWQSLPRR